MKTSTILEKMETLEKNIGLGPWGRWNELRIFLEEMSIEENGNISTDVFCKCGTSFERHGGMNCIYTTTTDNGVWICQECGNTNNNDSDMCYACGKKRFANVNNAS